MKTQLTLFFAAIAFSLLSQTKTIHVFVALCDNVNQGIVPVPEKIGNGQDPSRNLYWGAGYGVKNFFKVKTKDWTFIKALETTNDTILERLLFKHKTENAFLLADAYDGEFIKSCTIDMLKASNGQVAVNIPYENKTLEFGGCSNLIAYVGHDGLMEFEVDINYEIKPKISKDLIILACSSQYFFSEEVEKSGAHPILWTTNLMAPEAYTLKAAIDGWLVGEEPVEIWERAAKAYNTYQKCGINGARNLFTFGF